MNNHNIFTIEIFFVFVIIMLFIFDDSHRQLTNGAPCMELNSQ